MTLSNTWTFAVAEEDLSHFVLESVFYFSLNLLGFKWTIQCLQILRQTEEQTPGGKKKNTKQSSFIYYNLVILLSSYDLSLHARIEDDCCPFCHYQYKNASSSSIQFIVWKCF